MPLGSGTVVVVVDDAELAAKSTMNVASDAEDDVDDVVAAVLALMVVAVLVVPVGFKVSPVPVCTVTKAPGVTSDGL
jgi:hypothetical protein